MEHSTDDYEDSSDFPPRPIYKFEKDFFPLLHLFKRSKNVKWWQSQDTKYRDWNGFYGQGSFRSSSHWGDIFYSAEKMDHRVSCYLEISQNHDFWDRYLSITINYSVELDTLPSFALAIEYFFDKIETFLTTKITLDSESAMSDQLKIDHEGVKTMLMWRNYAKN